MQFSRRDVLRGVASAATLLATRAAPAQAYPDRPIRLIVPFPPGGAFDTLGRPWADRIKPHLGTVIIENIGGGGASLGAAAAARSRPDGYTLLLGGTLPHVNEALLKAKPLYDPVKDLDPIMRIAVGYLAIGCSVIAFFGLIYALSILEAGRASVWNYLEVPIALLFGTLLLGETITPASIAGGLLIGAAVWVVSRR